MLSHLRVMLVVVSVAGTAHAFVDHTAPQQEPAAVAVPAISVGIPDDPQVTIVGLAADARVTGDTAVVTLQVQLAGPVDSHTGKMALALPAGARVVGMTFARGGESLRASARNELEASEAFEQVRVIRRDPALLEWKSEGQVDLSVYPVTAGEHPAATVTIAMPRFAALRVDVEGVNGMHRELDGAALAPATDEEAALASRAPILGKDVALLAMPAPSLDDFDVRLEKAQGDLRKCARLDGRDAGADVTLTVMIGADGNVTDASAGDSEGGMCIARVAAAWRFGADEKPIAMHLRLHL